MRSARPRGVATYQFEQSREHSSGGKHADMGDVTGGLQLGG
jgi:hypothetical protein